MNGVAEVFRLTTILAAITAFIGAGEPAAAHDFDHGFTVAIVSNGVVTYKIPNGSGGLELSSNAPGMITVTSGSNSVTMRGPVLALTGSVVLAPFSTPGVRITPNGDGGYTAALDTPLNDLAGLQPNDANANDAMTKEAASQLAHDLADADFGDRILAAGRCMAPPPDNSASP